MGPWGVSVGPTDGRVYVADTHGHQIVVFDRELDGVVLTIGGPVGNGSVRPQPWEFSGPRDVAVDRMGRVWVADTGHSRIVTFTAEGEYIGEVGGVWTDADGFAGDGAGEFREPTSVSISGDGTVFVTDSRNGRVQMFNSDGEYLREFEVEGWDGTGVDIPSVLALGSGLAAVSVPAEGEVRLYRGDGRIVWTVGPSDTGILRPYGLEDAGGGTFWVVDGVAGRVRLVEGGAAGGQ